MNKILESVNLTYSLNFLTRPTVGLNHLNQSYKKKQFQNLGFKTEYILEIYFFFRPHPIFSSWTLKNQSR